MPILTRKEARQLSAQNKGFNRAQFQNALANQMNVQREAGVRGKDARTIARNIVAGLQGDGTPVLPVIDDNIVIADPEPIAASQYDFSNLAINNVQPVVLPTRPTQPNFDDMSFNDAFAAAYKAGLKEFNYKGRPIAVTLAEEKPIVEKSVENVSNIDNTPSYVSFFSTPVDLVEKNIPVETPVEIVPTTRQKYYTTSGFPYIQSGSNSSAATEESQNTPKVVKNDSENNSRMRFYGPTGLPYIQGGNVEEAITPAIKFKKVDSSNTRFYGSPYQYIVSNENGGILKRTK